MAFLLDVCLHHCSSSLSYHHRNDEVITADLSQFECSSLLFSVHSSGLYPYWSRRSCGSRWSRYELNWRLQFPSRCYFKKYFAISSIGWSSRDPRTVRLVYFNAVHFLGKPKSLWRKYRCRNWPPKAWSLIDSQWPMVRHFACGPRPRTEVNLFF